MNLREMTPDQIACELTQMAETCDIVADRPMSESGRKFWHQKRDFFRALADQYFTLSETKNQQKTNAY